MAFCECYEIRMNIGKLEEKHRKSAKLPWRHNIELSSCSLSFRLFIFFLFFFYFFMFFFFGLFLFLCFCLLIFLYFCLFVFFIFLSFSSFFLVVSLSFCRFFFLYFCQKSLWSYVLRTWSLKSHSLCQILKWRLLTHSVTKVRYRAARAAKNWHKLRKDSINFWFDELKKMPSILILLIISILLQSFPNNQKSNRLLSPCLYQYQCCWCSLYQYRYFHVLVIIQHFTGSWVGSGPCFYSWLRLWPQGSSSLQPSLFLWLSCPRIYISQTIWSGILERFTLCMIMCW